MTSSPRTVTLLGSTGSIGTQAIEVAQAAPDLFRITALSAGGNLELVARQAVELQVEAVACARGSVDDLAAAVAEAAREAGRTAYQPELLAGPDAAARPRRPAHGRRPQRHHRVDRPGPDPGGAGRRDDPGARQQGVAHRRRVRW